jgi:excisionase family DNA binding protein
MTTPTKLVTAGDQAVWLSVQEASSMLGVSPATLRRWSVAGDVEAFTTPGGHRRYSLSTLQGLLPHAEDAPPRLSAIGESPDRMVRVMRRRAAAAVRAAEWIKDIDMPDRVILRDCGRQIAEGLVAHLDAETREIRAESIAAAERAAAVQARLAAGWGGRLSELVGVFLKFRSMFVHELATAAVRHGLPTAPATALVTRGGDAADRVLAAMVTAYDTATAVGSPARR